MGSRSGEASNGHARSWLVLAGAGTGGASLGSGLNGAPRRQPSLQNYENTVGPDLLVGAHGVSLCALAIATVSQAVAPCKAQGVLSISHAPLSNAQHKYGAWNLLDNKINL